jgi:Predicted pPIWI-associating nuclease
MLPSHRLELRILRYVRIADQNGWRSTTLPELGNAVECHDWNKVLDALKRLDQQKIIKIRKWTEQHGFTPYCAHIEETFFHRGGFQVLITPAGRIYEDELEERNRSTLGELAAEKFLTLPIFPHSSISAEVTAKLSSIDRFTEQAFSESFMLRNSMQDALAASAKSALPVHIFENLSNAQIGLDPLMNSFANIGKQLGAQLDLQNQSFRFLAESRTPEVSGILSRIAEQAQTMARINVSLPRIAATAWPSTILSTRATLIADSLKNVNAWQMLSHELTQSPEFVLEPTVRSEVLDVAGQFVFDHDRFVRLLPPKLPDPIQVRQVRDDADNPRVTDEQIGTRLEVMLLRIDGKLLLLRRRSWENLSKGDLASARLAAHGVREIYSEVLRTLAPDDVILKSDVWKQRSDRTLKRPTRRMRIEFLIGTRTAKLDALVQFDESISETNKFAHTFADDIEIVRVQMAQVELCLYLILFYSNPQSTS